MESEELSDATEPLLPNAPVESDRYSRWIALSLMCLISLGSCYCYDNPAALHDVIVEELDISNSVFTSFYSWYSWPNVVMCMFGGLLIDRLGKRPSVCLFSLLVLFGQLIFALGALLAKVWTMQIGRVIFGIGGESLGTVTNTFLASWFLHKELNFAFGFMLSFARIGSSINMYLTRPLYDSLGRYYHGTHRVGFTLLILVSVCGMSLLASGLLALLDWSRDRRNPQLRGNAPQRRANLSLIFRLPVQLYLLALVIVCYYMAIFPFIAIGVKFFQLRYDLTARMGGILDSCVFISSAFLAPIMGTLVDKVGRNLSFVSLAIVGTTSAHILMSFTFIHPIFPMLVLGVSYSLMTAFLWPMIVLIVPQSSIGTAYGLTFSIQNLGMALMNMASGYIIDRCGFFTLQLMMTSLLLCSLMFNILLIHTNESKGGILNASARERRHLMKSM